jgi:hypothetical protein
MTIRIDGTNTTANPGMTGGDADTGLVFGTDEVKVVTGGSNRLVIGNSGITQNLNFNGANIVFSSGSGIDFSATADGPGMTSELLDDYEEGLHVATASASASGSITLDPNNDTLAYVKIGNLVSVQGRVNISSVSSPTGIFQLSLPFSSANLTDSAGRCPGTYRVRLINSGYDVADFSNYVDENTSLMFFTYTGGTDFVNSAGAFKTGTQLYVQITYRVA